MEQIVECKALGIKLPETIARQVDALCKGLPKECTYRRKAVTPQRVDLVETDRADVSLVSTDALDREYEVVLPKGIKLDLFRQNPIVPFAHNYSDFPESCVAWCLWIKLVQRGLLAKTVYATKPQDWQGDWLPDALWHLTKEKILKGKSIGFLPLEIRDPTKEELALNPSWKNARAVISQCTMIEYSIAPVPVNQESLVISCSKSFGASTLRKLGIKPLSPEQQLVKALSRIDPEKIARETIARLRGKV